MIQRDGVDNEGRATFTFVLDGYTDRPVSIVGDFNDWDPHAHPLTLLDTGVRQVQVQVPHDRDICFRYLAHGDHWFDDPDADAFDHRGGILRAGPAPKRTTRTRTAKAPASTTATRRTPARKTAKS